MGKLGHRLFLLSAAAAIGMVAALPQVANAATFAFDTFADGGSSAVTGGGTIIGAEGSWDAIVGSGVGMLDTASGISVIGTGTDSQGDTGIYAYFDSGSAGLGVCSQFDGLQCKPSNDDNVGAIGGSANSGGDTYETLFLNFNQTVRLDEVVFAGEGHGDFNGSLRVGPSTETPIGNALALGLVGTSFAFQYIPTSAGVTNEFYIASITVSAAPLPAALPLFLTMLSGMGFLKWRRRNLQSA